MRTQKNIYINIINAGTTGAGRKFTGIVVGADLIIDEITAHARAAYELNPEVDTIIEIGGQDSKFTTLRDGSVNFCVMNNVCAAGTGSFIEEQAEKLGCCLSDYSNLTEYARAPIASDRCTVFMERDLNHFLAEGFSVKEALAAALHSVRENYLAKVASENLIGKHIVFQGATAKNKALIAAFEQKLGKSIHVSRFCHLTGALGTAYMLAESELGKTRFRGLDIYREKIPVKTEICEICSNHCKITTAKVKGETAAYGFLCGRDYDSKSYVKKTTASFDLLKERKKVFSFKQNLNTTTILL